jgi:hypothetical protein
MINHGRGLTRRSAGLAVLVALLAGSAAGSGRIAANWQTRVAPRVLTTWKAAQTGAAETIKPQSPNPQSQSSRSSRSAGAARYDAKGRLQVDVAFDCEAVPPTGELVAAGMVIGTTVKVPPLCIVEGWVAVAALPALASATGVKSIDLPHYARTPAPVTPGHTVPKSRAMPQAATGTPAIDGNGVTIMNADKYIAQTGVKGAGITVAVINSGADSLSVIEARGELPQVKVVQPSGNPTPPANEDEGTMMLEEVYAVAPGASLDFCGPQTYVEYVACVQNLIADKVTVITDDLLFYELDVMSAPAENTDTQAIENLLSANPGVLLFSAAGNNALNYWQGAYNPVVASTGASFTCQGQTDTYFEEFTGLSLTNTWNLRGTSASDLFLAWVNVKGVSTANYDLYVLDGSLNVVACAAGNGSTDVSGASTYDFIDQSMLSSPNTYYMLIGTPDASLKGSFLKLIGLGDGADTWSTTTTGSTSSPQDFAAGVFPIGAVDGGDGVGGTIEPYSATGPIVFGSPSGASSLQSPIVVAPDDIYVDAAGTSFVPGPNSTFSGTSAASPNSAAVAALILSAFPSLTGAQAIAALQTGAAPLGTGTPNGTFGYGRVDALGALAALPAPGITAITPVSIVGGTSATVPLTLAGTPTLAVTTSSDTTTLLSSTAPGISISPSTCGAPTLACSLVLTPTLGQVGTAHVTVSIADGAKRKASTTFTATVTKPTPPTISVTAAASQSFTEGTAATPVTFTVAGTQTLSVTAASSNTALLPASGVALNSSCGSKTALSCTATLTVTSGQTGTSTITFTVTDPYGQSGTGTATVTVNAPSKGGGAVDLASLLALAALVLLQAWRRQRPGTKLADG